MNSKNPFRSKTVWLGVLQAISGLLLLLIDNDLIKDYPRAVSAFVLANGVVTMALRMITTLPIQWTDDKKTN
jgi:hypothetical protein